MSSPSGRLCSRESESPLWPESSAPQVTSPFSDGGQSSCSAVWPSPPSWDNFRSAPEQNNGAHPVGLRAVVLFGSCPLITVHCSLTTDHCSLTTVHCPLSTDHCSL